MKSHENNKSSPSELYPFLNELFHHRFEKSLKENPTDFSYDYFKLSPPVQSIKEELLTSSNYQKKHIKIPEEFICSLWMDQKFNSKYLFTLDHKRIEIVCPGQWNFEKGPDFKNAKIKMERGEIVKGDVEAHILSSDWNSHNHHVNSNYNNVVLHVFLQENKVAMRLKKANGQPFLQVELTKFLNKDIVDLYFLMESEDYVFHKAKNKGLCAKFLKKADKKRLILFLNLAGDARLLSKTEGYLKQAKNKDYDQLLYEGIMESLGYKCSRLQFVQIAETASLHYLRQKVKLNSLQEKAKHLESIFFGIAGFLDYFKEDLAGLDAETKLYLKQLRQIWRLYEKDFTTKKLNYSHWNFSGIRPANYPYRRLSGMSFFLSKYMDKNFISIIYPAISGWLGDGYQKSKMNHISNLFPEPINGFWLNRHTPLGKKLSCPKQLIGKDRASEIVIIVFLPVLLSFAKEHKWPSMKKILYQVYEGFPRLSSNRITRFMEEFILGLIENKNNIMNKAKRQQALHQIYSDYCEPNKDGCHNCKFYFIAKYLISGKNLSGSKGIL